MKARKIARKILSFGFTAGATLAVGFLSFSGMFVFTPSLIWCGAAFALAAAYEGQVNAEGISSAFRRMFTKSYLKMGILRRYLDEQEEEEDNLFLRNYRLQKKYLEELLEENEHPNKEQRKKIFSARKRLRNMEAFFLKQHENYENNQHHLSIMERSARDLLAKNRQQLVTEIARKTWLIRLSWLFALGGGVSSGLAAFSAIQAGIAAFTILSIIPGGALIGLAACAAVGYGLLLYQSISDMVQEYSGKWKKFFERRPTESPWVHGLRCAATVLTIGIAIVATIATAGTWWYAAKEGALLLNMTDKAANLLRSISVGLMALPGFIFSASNSVASIDKISKSSYGKLATECSDAIEKAWRTENLLQFFNPFRLCEKIISATAKSFLFIGHIVSMGLISDRFEAMPPAVCVAANSIGEALTDLNYMPDEKKGHHHHSAALSIMLAPITITVTLLKLLAVLWDRPFSGSFKASWNNIFGAKDKIKKAPEKPNLSPEWHEQEIVEVSDKIISRLQKKSPEKVAAAEKIKAIPSSRNNKEQLLRTELVTLSQNRSSLWKAKKTQSQVDMEHALDGAYGMKFVS